MSGKLSGKIVVVLGATGIVGSGAVFNYLADGATVIAVGRDKKKLEELAKKQGDNAKHVIPVVFSEYNDEKAVSGLRDTVYKALPKDAHVDHVLTTLGFALSSDPPTKAGTKFLRHAFDEGLYPNFVAAQAFVPDLKAREGSTFSFVSGGLAHFSSPDVVNVWSASVKAAAINALFNTITAECAKDGAKVRIGNFCIHYGVAYHGDDKNQWGMPALDTNVMGGAFTAFATGGKGRQICLDDKAKIKEHIQSFSE